ncbi:hypothetical protein FB451DRAFT_1001487, partial [Mycena latifolia]
KNGRGRLHEDVFSDSRLLLNPPSTCASLVLLRRNHNLCFCLNFVFVIFTTKKMLEINEQGTHKNQFKSDVERLARDDEIFNRARLVDCGYFMKIVLGGTYRC